MKPVTIELSPTLVAPATNVVIPPRSAPRLPDRIVLPVNPVIRLEENSNWHSWVLERRPDGAILVRVPSPRRDGGRALPDAVFSFRDGDPQYALWAERLAGRETAAR